MSAKQAAEKSADKASQQQAALRAAQEGDADVSPAESAEVGSMRLDEAKAPGGVFKGADGSYHNAHGEPVTSSGKPVKASAE